MNSERLKAVMSVIFGVSVEQLGPDSSPESIQNWDSLGHLNLMIALETEFGLEITAEEFADLTQFSRLEEFLQSKMSN